MLAATILVMASTFMWPSTSTHWPLRTTVEELNAMVKAGNYHLIRQQKIAHQIEAVGVVEMVGPRWPLLKLDGDWQAHLFNVPEGHGLKPGDRVKFRAMILDEAYQGLQLWAYSWSKQPAQPENKTAVKAAAAEPSAAALQSYLAKSKLCVSGVFTEVLGASGEAGVIHYVCEFKVSAVIAGECNDKNIRVGFVRLESKDEDKLPFLKEGGKCILFLNGPNGQTQSASGGRINAYTLADPKFGIQEYSDSLARAIGSAQETRGEKKPEAPVPVPAPAPATAKSVDLAGGWLLTMPAGFEFEATLEQIEKSSKYRLVSGAANLRGVYELKEGRLSMVQPEDERMIGLVWEIKNRNVLVLVEHPEASQFGSDYRNATLSRPASINKCEFKETSGARDGLRSDHFKPARL